MQKWEYKVLRDAPSEDELNKLGARLGVDRGYSNRERLLWNLYLPETTKFKLGSRLAISLVAQADDLLH